MLGAMIGDIVGSKYEFRNIKIKDFPLFSRGCDYTDDTIMTAAVAKAILLSRQAQYHHEGTSFASILVEQMQDFGRRYPNPTGAYGGRFAQWLRMKNPEPYNSYGNGSAMRVSPCGLIAVSMEEAKCIARASAKVTHNHPEGVKGAEAVAAAIFLAKCGRSKEEIRNYIREYYYPLNETLDEIRARYKFDESCQGTVPEAITAFLESENFEDAIRNAISIGGDSDTVGAITGSIAWIYDRRRRGTIDGGLPADMQAIRARAEKILPGEFVELADELWKAAVQRGGTYERVGICTGILSNAEYEAEMGALKEMDMARAQRPQRSARERYFRVNSGLLVCLDAKNHTAYKLNPVDEKWYEDPGMFADYEHGELHGRFIRFKDNYPVANVAWDAGSWDAGAVNAALRAANGFDPEKAAFCRRYEVLLRLLRQDEELNQWCREYSAYEPVKEHRGLEKLIYRSFMPDAYACVR